MGQAGGKRAEGDKGLSLPCSRLDGAGRPVEPFDEVPAERIPGFEPLPQYVGRYPEHPPDSRSAAGCQVDTLFVPGAESAGPAARHVHLRDHGLLGADAAHQVDDTVDEHPPEVSVLTLAEQFQSGLNADLGAALNQLRELLVGQAVEQVKRAQFFDVHQIVPR